MAQKTESFIDINGGIGKNFEIKQGESYEVSVTENITWVIVGSVYPTNPDIELINNGVSGKNWIGLPLGTVLTNADDLLNTIGSNDDKVRRWNPELQLYETWDGSGTNFELKESEGYEIFVSVSKLWTPE